MLIFLLHSAVYIEAHPRLSFASPVSSMGRAEGILPYSARLSYQPWSEHNQIHGSRTAIKSSLRLGPHCPVLAQALRASPPILDSSLFPLSIYALSFTAAPTQFHCFQALPHFFHAKRGYTCSCCCVGLARRMHRPGRRRSPAPTLAGPLTPLEATLATPLISVVSKGLTKYLNPLYATLTKNRGRGVHGPLSSYPYNKKKLQTVQPTAAGLANSHSCCISRSACSCAPLYWRSLSHVRFRTVLKLRKTENEVWKLLEGASCTRNQSSPWLS
jgi:hypothetical protein